MLLREGDLLTNNELIRLSVFVSTVIMHGISNNCVLWGVQDSVDELFVQNYKK